MKFFMRTILILCLLISLVYVTNITSIPNNILLFKGEVLNLGEVFGIYIKENKYEEAVQTSSNLSDVSIVEKSTLQLRLFNMINVKEVEVSTIPATSVIPLGNTIRTKNLYYRSLGNRKDRY